MRRFKVGLGIVTYNRPKYLKQVLDGVMAHLRDEADTIWVYDDGSKKGLKEYDEIFANLPPYIKVMRAKKNKGVGAAKNWLLSTLIEEGCYCLFIGEDDIIPTNKKAIRGYIQASRETGIQHFMFAHHGPGNVNGPIASYESVEMYPTCVGGWCYFTRPSLEITGLHDDEMKNAYEHVYLTWKLSKIGATTPWTLFADVKDSGKWLKEIPESIENSSIGKSFKWSMGAYKALLHWRSKHPTDFPLQHTIDGIEKQMKKDGLEV